MEDISFAQGIENTESTEIIENTESMEIIERPSKKVSIIVPIYNMQKYIGECIESIIAQTFRKNEMQVLLVNDGSTDNTAEIIMDYVEIYDFLEYYEKENGGLSDARNYGIKNAVGKYIMFLDADDKFSPKVVEKCVNFFDEHYDEVDIVTYVHQPFTQDSGELPITPRLKEYWKKTGIFDLETNPYIYLTYANIAIKNNNENTLMFKYLYIEDQLFASTLLLHKKKYGFVDDCKYLYRRDNENSITSSFWPTKMFEIFLQSMEELFAMSKNHWTGIVAHYVQALFVGELLWKVSADILFPYHYLNEELKKANERIDALLNFVDPAIILNFPSTDKYHKHWLLSRKKNLYAYINKINGSYSVFYGKVNPMQITLFNTANITEIYDFTNKPDIIFKNANGEYMSITESKKLCDFNTVHIIVCKITVVNNKLSFYGFAKSEFYNYIQEDADIWATEICDNGVNEIKLKPFLAWESNYRCHTQTNKFYGFIFECDLTYVRGLRFYIKFQDVATKPNGFWFYPVVGINDNRIIRGGYRIDFDGNEFHISACDIFEENDKLTEKYYKSKLNIYNIRKVGAKLRKNSSIYIYSDMPHVKKDNAYYQFKNDFNNRDGIQRYYITSLNDEEYDDYFTAEEQKYVVKFFSTKHEQLYLASEKIFTAFIGNKTHCPFEHVKELPNFSDMFDFEIIYLGHGILYGIGMWQYHAEWGFADKFVISSDSEYKNLIENYNWDSGQFISTGAPRYNHIDRNIIPNKKILFAPSWRSIFAQQDSKNNMWNINKERFKNHIWHKSVYKFLTSPELSELLTQYDYTLDFKLHPIIAGDPEISRIYSKAFGKESPVRIVTEEVPIENYSVYITDYSSFVFDFVYLNRAIMYFFPDYDEWRSGIYSFREIAVPFEEAFGPFTTEAETAITNLRRILENDAAPERLYADRMKDFFLPMSDNICDDIYEKVEK